jgi:hypothetical protein
MLPPAGWALDAAPAGPAGNAVTEATIAAIAAARAKKTGTGNRPAIPEHLPLRIAAA